MDLEAVARGESPLQARKQIDTSLLSGLAAGEDASTPQNQTLQQPDRSSNAMLAWVIVLASALAISVVVNILQAVL
jgi:hypothetical protein